MSLVPLGDGWSARILRIFDALHPALDLAVREAARAKLCKLLDLVAVWNARTDLTAARNADELADLFIADAAVIARSTPPTQGERWVDVGSGAGAPALPLAVLRPDLALTLVEPKQKRAAFLRTAVGEIPCPGISVLRERSTGIESHAFDIALSRATLPPEEWLREGSRLARARVWVLLARGPAPELAGLRIEHDEKYTLPLSGEPRRAVCYRAMRNPGEL
jgi:16S rRNA (guanine527-N7)-methyltransferase